MSSPRTLAEAYASIEHLSKVSSKHQNTLDRSFQLSEAKVIKVNSDKSLYEIMIIQENAVTQSAVLLLDKSYYQNVGFPNVGDFVKVLHKDAFTTAFILARANEQVEKIVPQKNSCIPLGSNIA